VLPPNAAQCALVTDGAFTARQLVKMEKCILQVSFVCAPHPRPREPALLASTTLADSPLCALVFDQSLEWRILPRTSYAFLLTYLYILVCVVHRHRPTGLTWHG